MDLSYQMVVTDNVPPPPPPPSTPTSEETPDEMVNNEVTASNDETTNDEANEETTNEETTNDEANDEATNDEATNDESPSSGSGSPDPSPKLTVCVSADELLTQSHIELANHVATQLQNKYKDAIYISVEFVFGEEGYFAADVALSDVDYVEYYKEGVTWTLETDFLDQPEAYVARHATYSSDSE